MATEITFKGPKAAAFLDTVQAHFAGVYDMDVCAFDADKEELHEKLGYDGVLLVLEED